MLKEERELRKILGKNTRGYVFNVTGKEIPLKRELFRLITALVRAVRADERERCANKGEEAYLRMFGKAQQNLQRAVQIALAIRRG